MPEISPIVYLIVGAALALRAVVYLDRNRPPPKP